MTVLEKVKRLEEYIAADSSVVNPVLDMTIDKLLAREASRLLAIKVRLSKQLNTFEKTYDLKSPEFYSRYENGDMGDETDFVEWSSTIEMLAAIVKRLALLEQESHS